MKSKVSGKKLNLNKKTIADLKTDKMRKVYGGILTDLPATPPIGCTITCISCTTVGQNNPCRCEVETDM